MRIGHISTDICNEIGICILYKTPDCTGISANIHDLKELRGNTAMRPPSSEAHRDRCQPVRRANTFRNSSRDKHAADMLRFVRDVQFERQNTATNINVKAPLPGISHKFVKHNSFDSGFVDRVTENTDSDDDSLDVQISLVREQKPKIDTELVGLLKNPKSINNNSNDHHVLSKFRPNHSLDFMNNNDVCRRQGKALQQNDISGNLKTTNARSRTTRLPPLEREHYPERPSAPSPSRTSSDYSDENDSVQLVDYLEV